MEKMGKLQEMGLEEVRIDPKDLDSYMSMGMVLSGRQGTLLKVKTLLYQCQEADELRVVFMTITPRHLAIVDKERWREQTIE